MPTQAKPDDFTVALLHRIQDARLTPEGGWLNMQELRSLMGLSEREGQHLRNPIAELWTAGMIEKRFHNGRDEVRSRGVRPAMGLTREEAAAQFAEEVILNAPAQLTQEFSPEGTARTILNHLTGTAADHDWVRERELMGVLNLSLPGLWVGLDRLQGAGLVERRLNNHRAVRLHPDVFRG